MKIVNVMASSLDGRIGLEKVEGDLDRQGRGLSSPADQHQLRGQIEGADAILVGASSIRANGECLDHVGKSGKPPLWIIFAEKEIPPHFHFWKQFHIPRIIISNQDLQSFDPNVKMIVSQDPVAESIQQLHTYRCQQVLLFGGGLVNSWFYSRGLVDELVLSLAPKVVGRHKAPFLVEPKLSHSVDFILQSSQVSENFVFLKYAVRKQTR